MIDGAAADESARVAAAAPAGADAGDGAEVALVEEFAPRPRPEPARESVLRAHYSLLAQRRVRDPRWENARVTHSMVQAQSRNAAHARRT